MPDVAAVEIDFAAHTATVHMKPGKATDRASVEAALRGGGYGVESFVETGSPGESKPDAR